MRRRPYSHAAAAVALALLCMAAAHAKDRGSIAPDPTWSSECGTCHVPYPPQLLAPAAWATIMRDLDRHFGTDASVDAAAERSISAFLQARSASGKRGRAEPQTIRITETAWFRRKHDELAPEVWKRPAVKSASNCAACHEEAERGIYSEHTVRVPH